MESNSVRRNRLKAWRCGFQFAGRVCILGSDANRARGPCAARFG